MKALHKQIGGNHYKQGGIQPVEFSISNRLCFLEGDIVKRITRYRREGGKGSQDIEKCIHEVMLLEELVYKNRLKKIDYLTSRFLSRLTANRIDTGRYCKENNLTGYERKVIDIMVKHKSKVDLSKAVELLKTLKIKYMEYNTL